jgi:hypothetical protein
MLALDVSLSSGKKEGQFGLFGQKGLKWFCRILRRGRRIRKILFRLNSALRATHPVLILYGAKAKAHCISIRVFVYS